MLISGKIRAFCFFFLILLISFGGVSCSKGVYPSGLEGNLLGYQKNYKSEQQRRIHVANKSGKEYRKQVRKDKKPIHKEEKQKQKDRQKFIKEHIARQEEHVQARMKQNIRETKKYYSSQKSLMEKFVFWKKNKCPYGIG
jgi:hypothetical protein